MSEHTIQEIRALVKKGSKRLNKFFYAGVVVGVLMGPGVIVASFVPAITERLEAAGNDISMMVWFGLGMSLLFLVALGEQLAKFIKDNQLLSIIKHHPSDIVWVYKVISLAQVSTTYASPGATVARFVHVHFRLLDGSKHLVWLDEPAADRLIQLVHDTFSYVSCGYTEALQDIYNRDPVALRNNPQYSGGVKKVSAKSKI